MFTLFVVLAVLTAMVGGAVLAARRFRITDDFSGGAVGVIIAPCVLSLYLVAAAMSVVIGWEEYKTAEDEMIAEAGAAQALYWSSTAFPGEEGEAVRGHLRTYLETVLEDDWPLMETQGSSAASVTTTSRPSRRRCGACRCPTPETAWTG